MSWNVEETKWVNKLIKQNQLKVKKTKWAKRR